MTISELLKSGAERLKAAGTVDAEYDARCLAEYALNCDYFALRLDFQKELDEKAVEKYFSLIERRLSGEPLQYILEEWEFMGLPFKVGEGVLIPRPETEILAEFAFDFLKKKNDPIVFDLCSGSGCIAISVAKFCPNSTVYAVEKSDAAFNYLMKNIELNGVKNVKAVKGDVFDKTILFGIATDLILSNPPYQMKDGGGTGSSAVPIYHEFVYQAFKMNPRYLTMIVPSRWFAGGKGLDDFRNAMLNSGKISAIVDYANSADCFPGVTIAGGICYFLWSLDYNGDCKVVNMNAGEQKSSSIRKLNEYPIFVRDNMAVQIIRKVKKATKNYIDTIVYSRNCFNLFSKEIGHNEPKEEDCVLYSLNGKSYISKNEVLDRDNLLNKYKVIMTKAMSGGNKPSNDGTYLVISSTMRVLKPNEVCTETYLCIGSFENETEANNLCEYMKTKFFRFLLLQALTSINISKDKFQFVPLQDFSKPWTDSELYEKYNLTDEEINFIESMIRPMDLGGDNNG